MTHLQDERTVAERSACLYTLAAANTQRFVNGVFIIRLLDKFSPDGPGGTQLVLCRARKRTGTRLEESKTQFTVTAHLEAVDTLDRGRFKNTIRSAPAALNALCGVQLPDGPPRTDRPDQRRIARRTPAKLRTAAACLAASRTA